MEKIVNRLFRKACADYALLADGDRVLVALSGGKDSMVLTRLLGQQARRHVPRIEVAAVHVVMDNIPYVADHDYLQRFCEESGVPLTIIHSRFDAEAPAEGEGAVAHRQNDAAYRRRQKTPCFLCAWYRRKALFEYATQQGYNKIALGHHQDDFLVTMLMNLTYEGRFESMQPLLPMRHYPISLIRPLCLTSERLITEVATQWEVQPLPRKCPHDTATRRDSLTHIFRQIEGLNPEARYSMWRAMNFPKISPTTSPKTSPTTSPKTSPTTSPTPPKEGL